MKNPLSRTDPTDAVSRSIHPIMGYGLAALIGVAFWASLLVAIF